MPGITHLKSSIAIVIKIIKTVDVALSDNKVDIREGFSIAYAGIQFWNVVKKAKNLREEFLDLSEAEKKELNESFVSEFDIQSEHIELVIENIFASLLGLAKSIDSISQ